MREPNHEPTPAEIRRECERIQKGWDKAERARRVADGRQRSAMRDGYTIPVCGTPNFENQS